MNVGMLAAVMLFHGAIPTPGGVYGELTAVLPDRGVAVMALDPAGFALPAGQVVFARDGLIVGRATVANDPRDALDSLIVTDAHDAPLFQLVDQRDVCPPPDPGLCRTVTLTTELQPDVAGQPAFQIKFAPDRPDLAVFLRYGVAIDPGTWDGALHEAEAWLADTLASAVNGVAPVFATPEAHLWWALASDPDVAPWAHGLTVTAGPDRLWIHGVVPSDYIYGRVLDVAAAAGFPDAGPDLIIDTRLDAPPPQPR